MAKIYKPNVVQEKIDELQGGDDDDETNFNTSYGDVFCSPQYRKATFVGVSLGAIQQFTGINVIMFYSKTVFQSGTSLSPIAITTLVGTVNFVSTLVGMIFITMAGRKTIMVTTNTLIAITLLAMGWCSLEGYDIAVIVLTLIFICFFEFGPGPITWLYMSEIMQDKGVSIGTVMNWVFNLIISACVPSIIDKLNEDGQNRTGYIFLFVGVLSTFGTIFMICFMKETRGKTPQQIEMLFAGKYASISEK
jgi:MFS family permease